MILTPDLYQWLNWGPGDNDLHKATNAVAGKVL